MAINLKSPESFLRKLALGAAGTNVTMRRLQALGFNPIELERGSTGFKIWKRIKIKRVRVPDILCLDTGLRFESRGKTKVEISMSHSLSDPNRAWNAGMRDDDVVSIVVFQQSADSPVDLKQVSPVHFVSIKEMREAVDLGRVSISRPKGVEEGSEIRMIWPCAAANQKATVSEVAPGKIILTPTTNVRRQTIKLSRSKGSIDLVPQVKPGEAVEANQILAAVVPVSTTLALPAPVSEQHFSDKLRSASLSERYAAAKALRYRGYTAAKSALAARMHDPEENIYVQLEAAAALAAYDEPEGWEFIESKLRSPVMAVPLETQLETVIVASEISKPRSEHLLIEVLQDAERDNELRAGAAWALGQFASSTSAIALIDTFNLNTLEIKAEAARALLRIAESQVPDLVGLLKSIDPAKRDGVSWVLARTGKFKPIDIISGADDNLRRWVSYIIGYGVDNFDQADLESILAADPQVYFAASVLWQILASWVSELKEF